MTTATQCIFCSIARDSANPDVLYRDDRCKELALASIESE